MKLTRLVLKDFISYEDLDYMFESKPLLVQGLNLTDEGQRTNGVGKSVIPTAIEQCIAGTNSRGVIDSELITYGKQQAVIQLYAECDIRKEKIHIENIINLKGSNQFIVKLQKYGETTWEQAPYSTSPEGKKYVSDWFAISKEDLFNYFIINNTRFKSFFSSSNTEKVGLVNRFSDASIVQGIEDFDFTELEEDLTGSLRSVNLTLGKIELTEESIKEEQERDFAEELSEKTEELDRQIELIEDEILELKSKIKNQESSKPLITEKINLLKEQGKTISNQKILIEKEVESISKEVKLGLKKVEEASSLIENFTIIDFKSEKGIFEKNKDIGNSLVKKLKSEKQEKVEMRVKVLKLIEDLEIKLSGVITCPSCKHEFLLDGDLEKLRLKEVEAISIKERVDSFISKKDLSIEEVLKNISEIESNISEINSRQSKWNDEKNELSISLNSITGNLNSIKSKLNGKESELKSLELKNNTRLSNIETEERNFNNIDFINSSTQSIIKAKSEKIAIIENQKKGLEIDSNEDRIKDLKENLVKLRKGLSAKQIILSNTEEKISTKKQWSLNFKQFRMYLANKSLGVIEYHSNRYLLEMGSDLLVKVEGFKVLADSTIKEEITCKIVRNAVERNFKSYSGGERGRLLFASILANRFMINETHPYGGLDFLSIDEVFEGVDSEGLLSLVESAKLLSIPVLLITHVTVEEDDNVLTIVKENGVSKIKY